MYKRWLSRRKQLYGKTIEFVMQSPQCEICTRNYEYDAVNFRSICDAFPGGIPDAIYFNKHYHYYPYPGDNGLLFEVNPYHKRVRLDVSYDLPHGTVAPEASYLNPGIEIYEEPDYNGFYQYQAKRYRIKYRKNEPGI